MRSHRAPHRLAHGLPLVPLAALATVLAGCGDATSDQAGDEPTAAPTFDYSSALMAPSRKDFTDSDETPDADDGLEAVSLADGSTVQLWIDPDDIAKVMVQHSDPTDPGAWTAPQTIFEAGDGCLIMDAATNGTVVAVGLGCYETDAFIQQAPDQGVALVSTDLSTWETSPDLGEFWSRPEVAADGSVRFPNGVYEDRAELWTEKDGFSEE